VSSPEPVDGVRAVDRDLLAAWPYELPLADASPDDAEPRELRTSRKVAAAYEAHAAGLGRLAYLLTGDAALAEDLVQEAFVRTFARFVQLRQPEAVGTYLRRTVVNLARKQFRRAKKERASAGGAGMTLDLAAQPDVELREQLWAAMRELPYRQRAALVLRFYEDRSEREIARCLGCRVGTVKSLLHRALTTLREQIGGDQQ
jgi:RNA polymerase sigma-70 factor (sigma-E family)